MKIIDKKTFLPTVCVVYTTLSLSKIGMEAIFQGTFGNYQENLLIMLFLSFFATFVLSQHYRLQSISLPIVIIGQYLLLIGIVMFITWGSSFFEEIHPNGYRDMFLSFTIPYIIGAIVYYIAVWSEVRKMNQLLVDIKVEE